MTQGRTAAISPRGSTRSNSLPSEVRQGIKNYLELRPDYRPHEERALWTADAAMRDDLVHPTIILGWTLLHMRLCHAFEARGLTIRHAFMADEINEFIDDTLPSHARDVAKHLRGLEGHVFTRMYNLLMYRLGRRVYPPHTEAYYYGRILVYATEYFDVRRRLAGGGHRPH